MIKDMYYILVEPARMKIMLTIASHGMITADELCEILDDIPSEEIRGHLSVLIDAEALKVSEEKEENGSAGGALSLNSEVLRRHSIPKAIYDYVP